MYNRLQRPSGAGRRTDIPPPDYQVPEKRAGRGLKRNSDHIHHSMLTMKHLRFMITLQKETLESSVVLDSWSLTHFG